MLEEILLDYFQPVFCQLLVGVPCLAVEHVLYVVSDSTRGWIVGTWVSTEFSGRDVHVICRRRENNGDLQS